MIFTTLCFASVTKYMIHFDYVFPIQLNLPSKSVICHPLYKSVSHIHDFFCLHSYLNKKCFIGSCIGTHGLKL